MLTRWDMAGYNMRNTVTIRFLRNRHAIFFAKIICKCEEYGYIIGHNKRNDCQFQTKGIGEILYDRSRSDSTTSPPTPCGYDFGSAPSRNMSREHELPRFALSQTPALFSGAIRRLRVGQLANLLCFQKRLCIRC